MKKLKIGIIGLLVFGLVGFSAISSFAQTGTGTSADLTATVSAHKALTIIAGSSTALNFGQVAIPSTSTPTSKTIAFGGIGAGSITANGDSETVLVVAASSPSYTCTDDNVTLKDISFDSNSTTDLNGNLVIPHGGTLEVGQNTTPNSTPTCDYVINVNYQ